MAILYHSSRSITGKKLTFSATILQGIAADGGLLVPETLPQVEIKELKKLISLPYRDKAAYIFKQFETDFSAGKIDQIVSLAYGTNFDHVDIAPLVHFQGNQYLLELWHGPTAAFKDIALQIKPLFFSEAVTLDNQQRAQQGKQPLRYLILVATSGDTGKAALAGYKDRECTAIIVFYPAGKVSDLQEKQMITQQGSNVGVFGVLGDFDDCQNAVKATFVDQAFNELLLQKYTLKLSSANSINWGRVMPQIVYYFHAYGELVRQQVIKLGEPIDIAVPTGNFGNILSAYYAWQMGVPVQRLICASNENSVLTDFIHSGSYDISHRKLIQTPSPSMDILISSNLERLLYALTQDSKLIQQWMQDLREQRRFTVDSKIKTKIQQLFYADTVTNEQTLQAIKNFYDQTGYLMDPHTAVVAEVVSRYQKAISNKIPVIMTSTAHWAKFGSDVYKALRNLPSAQETIPELAGLTGVQILHQVQKLIPQVTIPQHLADLDQQTIKHTGKCSKEPQAVQKSIVEWLESKR